MPVYVYRCRKCGQDVEVVQTMAQLDGVSPVCDCGGRMERVPQAVNVNWLGARPSDGEPNPLITNWLNNVPRLKDEFAEKKEAHLKREELERKAEAAHVSSD